MHSFVEISEGPPLEILRITDVPHLLQAKGREGRSDLIVRHIEIQPTDEVLGGSDFRFSFPHAREHRQRSGPVQCPRKVGE